MRLPLILCAAVLGGMTAQPAYAHPHSWIDLRSGPIFDANNNIVAIRQHWLFDDFYTELSLPDFDANKNGKFDQSELDTLAHDNLHNLKEYSYFTYITTGGAIPAFNTPDKISTSLEGNRIGLTFTLPFTNAISPKGFSYRIYDPSYYVAMLHEQKNPVKLDGTTTCKYDLFRPEPDAMWTTIASALDKNATAPTDLGTYFAERVTITCP